MHSLNVQLIAIEYLEKNDIRKLCTGSLNPWEKESVTDLCCSTTTSTEELNKEFMDKRFIP